MCIRTRAQQVKRDFQQFLHLTLAHLTVSIYTNKIQYKPREQVTCKSSESMITILFMFGVKTKNTENLKNYWKTDTIRITTMVDYGNHFLCFCKIHEEQTLYLDVVSSARSGLVSARASGIRSTTFGIRLRIRKQTLRRQLTAKRIPTEQRTFIYTYNMSNTR